MYFGLKPRLTGEADTDYDTSRHNMWQDIATAEASILIDVATHLPEGIEVANKVATGLFVLSALKNLAATKMLKHYLQENGDW